MIIDLLRHGSPLGGKMYRGHNIDHPLSEQGWQQMRESVGQYRLWDVIISSPMLRCSEFAQDLHQSHNIPLEIMDNLKEVGFGSWEGQNANDIDREEWLDFYQDPVNNRPQGSEPLEDFIKRVLQSWKKILGKHQGKNILIVAHAGVIRAVVAHILYSEPVGMYKIAVENVKICRIEVSERSGPVLKMLNGTL